MVLLNKEIDPDLLFVLGQATSIIVEPKSADTNANKPVGTGPYQLQAWNKGSSVVLTAWDGYRDAKAIKIKRATFRFISDPAAQVAALLAGDVDAFPRVTPRSVAQFKANPKFQVVVSGSRAKTIVAINNGKKPLDDVRVRRAIAAAIDRKAVIEGAGDGYGAPIGSHYVPGAFGYVDTTGVNPYDPEKAKKLLAEAGYPDGFQTTIRVLAEPPFINIASSLQSTLAQAGIKARIVTGTGTQVYGSMRERTFDIIVGRGAVSYTHLTLPTILLV